MLTADLVDARRKDGELILRPLDAEGRVEALGISTAMLDAARAYVGKRRDDLEDAWETTTAEMTKKRFKLAAGLQKLVADACTFEADMPLDPVELRQRVFTRASELRRTHAETEPFRREEVIGEIATALGVEPASIERSLFSDLRSEHVLTTAPALDAASIVEAWELGQAQAVLLTAVRVTCEVFTASPGLLRDFFAKLKFHKLLFAAERIARSGKGQKGGEGWRLVIDGPYSMFDAVTKYGLHLALVFPALRALEEWSLVADIRWGKAREPLAFRMASTPVTQAPDSKKRGGRRKKVAVHLSDEVRELMDAINAKANGWTARPCTMILEAPGKGVSIPDLELTRPDASAPVYLEVMGYWSRDAVFRRVELAESDLGARVIFAVSSRLRVSPEVLGESLPASLYVYKGKMSPQGVIAQADRLAAR